MTGRTRATSSPRALGTHLPLTYENTSLTLDAGQMLQLKEHGIVLDEVTLSPCR